MAIQLKTKIDEASFTELAEPFKEAYSKHTDGSYILQVEENSGLKTALDKEREAADQLRTKLKDFDGVDPLKYKELLSEVQTRETENARKRGDFQKIEDQLKAKHREEMDEAVKQIHVLHASLESTLVDSQLNAAIASESGIPELLVPICASKLKAIKGEDGRFQVRVLGLDGQPRIKSGDGTPFTVHDLILELKADEKYGRAFNGTGFTGAGSSSSSGAPQSFGNITKFSDLKSVQEKTAFISKYGQEAYQKLQPK